MLQMLLPTTTQASKVCASSDTAPVQAAASSTCRAELAGNLAESAAAEAAVKTIAATSHHTQFTAARTMLARGPSPQQSNDTHCRQHQCQKRQAASVSESTPTRAPLSGNVGLRTAEAVLAQQH